MRSILPPVALALGLASLAACDRDPTPKAPPVAIQAECTPMPADCPPQLACEVTTIDVGGRDVRQCTGSACCQSFCDVNGCDRCCATPTPPAP